MDTRPLIFVALVVSIFALIVGGGWLGWTLMSEWLDWRYADLPTISTKPPEAVVVAVDCANLSTTQKVLADLAVADLEHAGYKAKMPDWLASSRMSQERGAILRCFVPSAD